MLSVNSNNFKKIMKYKKILFCLPKIGAFFVILLSLPVRAQVVPDSTLPINSKIRKEGNVTLIEGGTRAGKNLFHSLKNLSTRSNETIYFKNPSDIQNIFTRITGSSISNIDGLIRVSGTANLFFINPNGITFGKDASLDIGGSFLGSTASSIKFADDFEFSTTDSSTPLLTINFPIALKFAENAKGIQARGNSILVDQSELNSPSNIGIKTPGLSVESGRTLALVGNNLNFKGTTLTAKDGQLELGSVGRGSLVKLSPINKGWTLNYEKAFLRDIHLSQGSLVDASGVSGGSINIQGNRVKLTDGSVFLIQNLGAKSNEVLKVNATEYLELSGNSGRIYSGVRTRSVSPKFENLVKNKKIGTGKLPDIVVSTKYLILRGGNVIASGVDNKTKGGNIKVNASESIQVLGTSSFNRLARSQIVTSTSDGSVGQGSQAGDVRISTKFLSVANGGFIATSTIGSGASGNLTIDAVDSIKLNGARSYIGTRSFGEGNAGKVRINTLDLTAAGGARVDTSTLASGTAGSIIINARSVNLSGKGKGLGEVVPSSITSSANIPAPNIRRFFKNFIPSGQSGDVVVNAKNLNITNEAEVSVKNEGTGNAGILEVNTNILNLDNQGKITAATASGKGGNISLNTGNLRTHNNSEITTSAGGSGDGGDIKINADTITALKKSGIRANAFEGRGGNIKIKATGLFVSPDSEITASSQRGINGTVDIDVPNSNLEASYRIDPVFKLSKLPLICGADRDAAEGSLVNMGKGGIPVDIKEPLSVGFGWYDTSDYGEYKVEDKDIHSRKIEEEKIEIVEAQGWIDNGDGTVSFTVNPPSKVTVGNPLLKSTCTN